MDINSLKKQFTDDSIQEKVLELEKEMNQKISSGDRNIGNISSELSYYSELALKISNIKKDILDYENTKEMLQSEQDSDLREMASEELKRLEEEINQLEKDIKKIKISRKYADEDDNRSAIVEIRAGAG
jgi:peptide chain release factor 1